jgi:hypothetical protein
MTCPDPAPTPTPAPVPARHPNWVSVLRDLDESVGRIRPMQQGPTLSLLLMLPARRGLRRRNVQCSRAGFRHPYQDKCAYRVFGDRLASDL